MQLAIAAFSAVILLGSINGGRDSFMISSNQSGDKNGSHGIMNGPDYISCLKYSDAKDGDYLLNIVKPMVKSNCYILLVSINVFLININRMFCGLFPIYSLGLDEAVNT
ncbi:hypothetical protein HFN20_20080 [Paenibacillus dendritiformis]|uniref:hypothetical protein n=1 Tax=Paenibacillus dendritiformis TaxID=130049 RepID=UPI00143CFEF0|nr:hypothetical protein [Paenibacillus dendritiformis]NKI23504.1 hypothetical protein [Paenibacillus dendritiformis]NRG01085.1 hypothetical protein [Paenibacillus dendritiformis]